MAKNLYIVADGIGGTGKDSVLADLEKRFRELGYRTVMTYEPGGTPEADRLRQELFAKKTSGVITPREELEYVFAARRLNMEQIVLPALAVSEPTVVLKARDYLSSFVYQEASGADRSLLLEFYRKHYEALGFPKPDLRLLLMLDVEKAMRRRLAAGAMGDGFDLQPNAYWRKVGAGYANEAVNILQRRGLFRQETILIDASQRLEVVRDQAWRMVVERCRLATEEDYEPQLMDYPQKREDRRSRGWYR